MTAPWWELQATDADGPFTIGGGRVAVAADLIRTYGFWEPRPSGASSPRTSLSPDSAAPDRLQGHGAVTQR